MTLALVWAMRGSLQHGFPVLLALFLPACGGSVIELPASDGGPPPAQDSGPSDSAPPLDGGFDVLPPPPPQPLPCGTQLCDPSQYCVHPDMGSCPTCTGIPPSGVCPPGSYLGNCFGPTPLDGGSQCITPAPPPPPGPFCSPFIPSTCMDPYLQGHDVQCAQTACAGGA